MRLTLIIIIIIWAVIFSSCTRTTKNKTQNESKEKLVESTEHHKPEVVELVISEINSESLWEVDSLAPIKSRDYRDSLSYRAIDTLLDAKTRLRITPKYLDTYAIQEWEDTDTLYRVKFYDLSYNLIVEDDGDKLIDTTFTKQDFIKPSDTTFMEVSTFHRYWLNDFVRDENALKLFGNICKPDSDWCLFFNHIINIETGNIEYLIPEYDDEI